MIHLLLYYLSITYWVALGLYVQDMLILLPLALGTPLKVLHLKIVTILMDCGRSAELRTGDIWTWSIGHNLVRGVVQVDLKVEGRLLFVLLLLVREILGLALSTKIVLLLHLPIDCTLFFSPRVYWPLRPRSHRRPLRIRIAAEIQRMAPLTPYLCHRIEPNVLRDAGFLHLLEILAAGIDLA